MRKRGLKSASRDDFSAPVKRELRDRVSHRCSNPDCRAPTSAPGKGKKGINNIGIAAHILAASPEGPRYDSSISSDERRDIFNGIWLCSNCATKIDRSAEDFPASLLRHWKQEAESRALKEQGRRLPSEEDAIDQLAVAFSGPTKGLLTQAIDNIHKAAVRPLEELDPRFSVVSSYLNGIASFELLAKTDVELKLIADPAYKDEIIEKQRKLVEKGQDIELRSEALSFEGSRLIEEIFSQSGVLKISVRKKDAILKAWVQNPDTNIFEVFDDIAGDIRAGTKSIFFEGGAFSEILSFELTTELDSSDGKIDLNVSIDFSKWDGRSVTQLPYLDKLYSLFDKMARGWAFYVSIELQGERLFTTLGANISKGESIRGYAGFLMYCYFAKLISLRAGRQIIFNKDVEYSVGDFKDVIDTAELLDNSKVYYKNDITNPPGIFSSCR